MKPIRILIPTYVMPNVKSVVTIFFENLLPVLGRKTKVHVIWLVYQPEKLNLSKQNDSDTAILDIHDYKNAIELLKKERPDIIYASGDRSFIDYALSLAGKFLKIPVFSMYFDEIAPLRNQTTRMKLYMTRFFESSIPTDTGKNQKQIMRRGRFFIYKYFFLLRTQKAIGMNIIKIIRNFFMLLKLILSDASPDSRFANNIHFMENEHLLEEYVKRGFERSTLVVTGDPMYDNTFQKLQSWKTIEKKNGVLKILLVTDGLYEHGFYTKQQRDKMIIDAVTEISKHKNEMSLVIKIHPSSENLSEYRSIINQVDTSIPIYQKEDIVPFIINSDVVISFSSATSALLYSLIAKKHIVICNFSNLRNDLFLERGIAFECKEPSELIPMLYQISSSNIIYDEKIDNFIREFIYKSDGQAAERVCDSLIALLEKKL